jgi:hypothetical protein
LSNETTIRGEFWNGQPEELRELFTLTKPSGTRARCTLWSRSLGYEIKLDVNDGLVRSQVTRDPGEISTIADEWRTTMLHEGWLIL